MKNWAEMFKILKSLTDDFAIDAINISTIRGDGTGELGRSTTFRESTAEFRNQMR